MLNWKWKENDDTESVEREAWSVERGAWSGKRKAWSGKREAWSGVEDWGMMAKIVFIGLGSNLGNREENIKKAILKISELPQTSILATSSIINTKPIGKTDQSDFLNSVIKIETNFNAGKLLTQLKKIESDLGRIRGEKWGPRIIDLDILFFNEEIINTKNLQIPHPEILSRKFVLQLMKEFAPEFVHPVEKKTMEELYTECLYPFKKVG